MASTDEITKSNTKNELTAAQLKTLMKLTGEGEDEVREAYEKLRQRFPKGYLTETEFTAKFHEPEVLGNNEKIYVAKHLFAVSDRDKSSTIDLYEYLLTMATLAARDPTIILKCLFKLCDSNQDGLLTQNEVVDVLHAFCQLSSNNMDSANQEDSEKALEDIKKSVKEAFGDKTQISDRDLLEVCQKSQEMEQMLGRLHSLFLMGMIFDDSDF